LYSAVVAYVWYHTEYCGITVIHSDFIEAALHSAALEKSRWITVILTYHRDFDRSTKDNKTQFSRLKIKIELKTNLIK
jgi:hypothetical protein